MNTKKDSRNVFVSETAAFCLINNFRSSKKVIDNSLVEMRFGIWEFSLRLMNRQKETMKKGCLRLDRE